ncbi:MarR family transcriptional regulator [Streptomyces pluripotens]|uniref:MarR family transcriptional regulator n=1 Tax=Streptomyces pluripotens TaxID=1355015 RepID=A0A221P4A1_9ACTN|nr:MULTISPECIES: MarR family winged helix-turn-helix transcriptional regulator [Streptomyces]ARP72829.1 MarR family transcriptional regulator [Streptomyces pluripotens]ASN27079.1 MarR family transcriptional regulator [Streptomyces pluripotens]KIE23613.1 MarR family transcriptional regulator [Streptomyces sp. MUSC 125]MCH0559816.1 winged helix-turn-helix transcriptional regulator [Streptomyces sp. MUM 16J]
MAEKGDDGAAFDELLGARLGYLLKHAQLRLAESAGPALARFGLDARELAVLVVLAAGPSLSQLEAARRLGVDRTTMVALIDALEGKGLVERRRSEDDRRRNVVELTERGRRVRADAEDAREAAEREFLAPLGEQDAAGLVKALRVLVTGIRNGC